VVWAGGPTGKARERQRQGADVVTWEGADPAPLERKAVPFRRLEELLGRESLDAAESAGRTWARVWGRLPLAEDRSFRDLVEWRGSSLLWTAEAFLRERTSGPRLARTADLALRLLEATAPSEVDAFGLCATDALLLARAARSRGILFHDAPSSARPLRAPDPPSRGGRPSVLARLFAPSAAPPPPPPLAGGPAGAAPLLVLGPGPQQADRLRPLLEAAGNDLGMPSVVVALADVARWATRRVHRAAAEAEAALRARLASLRGTPALLLSYTHRGVGFADLAARDIETLLLGRLPAMVRLLEAAIELVQAARPGLVLLVVPGRDERRTLVLAAQEAGRVAVALDLAPGPADWDRQDGGPQPSARIAWAPGTQTAEALARLREAARGRVVAE
jgi:hypothetical protein